jgi:hypothetical protein
MHAGYTAAHPAGYAHYGNGSQYYPSSYAQDPAQHYHSMPPMHQHQHPDPAQHYRPQAPAQQYEHQAPAQAQAQTVPAPPVHSRAPRGFCPYTLPSGQLVYLPANHHPSSTAHDPVPVFYDGCYPPAFEPQPLYAPSPQIHVAAQKVYASAYNASQQMGYLSDGALHASQLAAAHAYQPQQQGQFTAQSQYAYPYLVRSSTTTAPTRDYSEMGLHVRSFSSDSATATSAVSASMSPQPLSSPQTSYTNVYMAPQASQQHVAYVPTMSRVVQVQPSTYYPSAHHAVTQATQQDLRYTYPCVIVPAAAVHARDRRYVVPARPGSHTLSGQGAASLPQTEGGEHARHSGPQPLCSEAASRRVCSTCSCSDRPSVATRASPRCPRLPGESSVCYTG